MAMLTIPIPGGCPTEALIKLVKDTYKVDMYEDNGHLVITHQMSTTSDQELVAIGIFIGEAVAVHIADMSKRTSIQIDLPITVSESDVQNIADATNKVLTTTRHGHKLTINCENIDPQLMFTVGMIAGHTMASNIATKNYTG